MTDPRGQNQRDKTHCPQGHEYTPDNLLTADLKRGRRGCRTCHNARIRARKAAK